MDSSVNLNDEIHDALDAVMKRIRPEAWAYTLMQMDLIPGYLNFTVFIGVVEALDDSPKSIQELAEICDVKNPRYLRQVMIDLTHFGFYEEQDDDIFANNECSSLFLKNRRETFFPYLQWVEACRENYFNGTTYTTLHKKVANLDDTSLFHCTAGGAHTDSLKAGWQHLRENQELARIMDNAMEKSPTHNVILESVVEGYDFSGISTLVHVAGGTGRLINAVLAKYPDMKGVLFDLEDVVAYAMSKPHFIMDRCQVEVGSHIVHIPKLGNAVLIDGVIQSYDDDDAAKILGNSAKSLDSGQKVILVDVMTKPNERNLPITIKSAQMLTFHGPGQSGCSPGVRRKSDFVRLFDESGMDIRKIVPLSNPPGHYIFEGIVR